MSIISLSDLPTTGIALFADSENYLKELTEASQIRGGGDEVVPTKGTGAGLWSWCLSEPTFGPPPLSESLET